MKRWSIGALLFALLAFPAAARGDEASEEPTPPAPTAEGDPQAAREACDKAEVLREEERWKEAADLYWRAIEKDRTCWPAHVLYQQTSLAAGAPLADLVADYDSFLRDFPDDPSLRLHRMRLDPLDARFAALEAQIKSGSGDTPDARLEAGRAALLLGESEKAVKHLASAAAATPPRDESVLLLAEAEFRSGKSREARLRLEQVIAARPDWFAAVLLLGAFDLLEGKHEEAARRAQSALDMTKTWVAAFLLKAEALDRLGQRDQALAALEAARGLQLEVSPVVVAAGDLAGRDGTEAALAAALATYEKALAKDPKDPRALYGLAWALERQKKYDEAEKKYREVAAILPGAAEPIHSVGYALFLQGRISDAQVQFKKAIDADPGFWSAIANLGATYDAQANYSEAIKWYEKLLKLKGQENNLRAIVNLAFDHEQLGAFPKAEAYLRRARKADPEDPLLATWLGDNLYFQEKYKDAEKVYAEATQLDPKSFYAWRGLGFTQGKMKRWSDAVQSLEKAKEIKPEDHDVLVSLGDIYLVELEEPEKALENYEAYVQAGGTDPSIPALITEIRKLLGK